VRSTTQLLATVCLSATLATTASATEVENLDTGEVFTTLQAAIDDPDTLAGHTLEMLVADHTTPEVQVVFTKDLTLQGMSGGTSTLRPSSDTGTSGDARGWILIPLGTSVTFRDLVFDGSGFLIFTAIRNHGPLTVEDCEFTEIKYNESGPTYNGIAISHFASGGAMMTVRDTLFTEIGRIGIHIFEPALVERCTYVGKGTGDHLDYFSCIGSFGSSVGVATFDRCAVYGNRGVASSDGSTSAGLLATTFFGSGTDVTITDSSFTDNTTGIFVGFDSADTATLSVSDSVVAGNDFGLISTSTSVAVDAVGNWWGDASGPLDPSGAIETDNPPCAGSSFTPSMDASNVDGAGDSVSDANVDYCPWLTAPPSGSALVLSAADCQDDADASAGDQIEVELEMLDLVGHASGFQAFVDYDMGTLLYRGDLSSYSSSPFPLHVSPILQADDGRLELDGSAALGAPGTTADAVLATLVFDVITTCGPHVPATFEVGGAFDSELSFTGLPIPTTLTDAAAVTLDDTPPVISGTPADITQPADAGSCAEAVVTFTDPVATDTCDPSPSVVCSPPSGSTFPVGTTTVTCTATDACGNASTSTFDVTVTATNAVDVVVELVGSDPTTRCIHFVPDSCSAVTDVPLTFSGGSPAVAVATIEIPCGVWTQLCAKDQQHTQWDESPLSISGAKYVATMTLTLEGGDTDDDGDIDINDVTLLLSQFGGTASAGGCPFDGSTRDADFSNDGAIGSEDYSFLTANWLTSTSCSCFLPDGRGDGPRVERWIPVRDAISARADVNGDGRVDVHDVELFEEREGLSGALSARMRADER